MTTRLSRALILFVVPVILWGCGPMHMKTIHAAKKAVIGKDISVLTRCVGEPLTVRDRLSAPGQVHVYSSAQLRGPDGTLIASPQPHAAVHQTACVFSIAVLDGRIQAVHVDNRAGWGFGSITACSGLVRRCVGAGFEPAL